MQLFAEDIKLFGLTKNANEEGISHKLDHLAKCVDWQMTVSAEKCPILSILSSCQKMRLVNLRCNTGIDNSNFPVFESHPLR